MSHAYNGRLFSLKKERAPTNVNMWGNLREMGHVLICFPDEPEFLDDRTGSRPAALWTTHRRGSPGCFLEVEEAGPLSWTPAPGSLAGRTAGARQAWQPGPVTRPRVWHSPTRSCIG